MENILDIGRHELKDDGLRYHAYNILKNLKSVRRDDEFLTTGLILGFTLTIISSYMGWMSVPAGIVLFSVGCAVGAIMFGRDDDKK